VAFENANRDGRRLHFAPTDFFARLRTWSDQKWINGELNFPRVLVKFSTPGRKLEVLNTLIKYAGRRGQILLKTFQGGRSFTKSVG
jgi:hypothetical protein